MPGTYIQFNGFFQKVLNGKSIYWPVDYLKALEEFVKDFNVKFEWVGSQGFTCSILIKEITK